MDAINLLTSQHQEVKALFDQVKTMGVGSQKQKIVRQICEKLTIHDKLEQDVFYPAAKTEAKDLVLEGLEEHHLMKIVLKQLAELEPSDETYNAKVKVLIDVVQHHIQEEEGQMFPKCQKALGKDKLQQIGQQMQAMTQELMKQEPQVTITMLDQVGMETPRLK